MIEIVLIRLKLWSFLVLPLVGYVIGQILQLLLGTKYNPKFESIVVHILTTALFLILFTDLLSQENLIKEQKDKVLYLSISYLFILGVIFGLISILY